MARLLYLVHRLPYPPNKGDKVRSYHLLKHLRERHEVYLATFVDDPEDEVHVATVRALCADLHVARLKPRHAKVRSLGALLQGEPLTLRYYRDPGLQRWVDETVARHGIRTAVVFSSSMAQYVPAGVASLVDFVDVDSAKWTQYADAHRWPMSWLYRREGETLLACEREVARGAVRSFFVTEAETALFRRQAPESAATVEAMGNGVDAAYFTHDASRTSPFPPGQMPIVFTGAMDYWPNVDAVEWFVAEMLPALLRAHPALHFHIVGRSPTPAVKALGGDHVSVTGTVPDVRPYLQHARVVVAPLRLARGIQNKILEAMAMARPVVAARTCVEAIDDAGDGRDLLSAVLPRDFVREINALLAAPAAASTMAHAARRCVVEHYSWGAHLSRIDPYLEAA